KKERNGPESIQVWDIQLGTPRELVQLPHESDADAFGYTLAGIAWSADGRHVLYVRNAKQPEERGLWYVPTEGGAPRRLAIEGFDDRLAPQFAVHPDGKHLALTTTGAEYPSKYPSVKDEVWALDN